MLTVYIDNLLATHTALGIVCAVLLFVLCFSLVHLARLVKFGWKYQAQNQEKSKPAQAEKTPTQEQPKPKQETPAPVYYIVERKRKTKPGYTEPKEIRFK